MERGKWVKLALELQDVIIGNGIENSLYKIDVFCFYSFSWLSVELSAYTNHKGLDIPPVSKGEDHIYLCQGAEEMWCVRTLRDGVLSGVILPCITQSQMFDPRCEVAALHEVFGCT